MTEFDNIGNNILMHKYLYYIKCQPVISDYEYDMLELRYFEKAKLLDKEPDIHMIESWKDMLDGYGMTYVDFPIEHPWSNEIIERMNL